MLDKRKFFNNRITGFPGGTMLKNLPANAGDAGDMGSIPGLGRFPGAENGNPLQYSGKSHEQRSLAGYSPLGLQIVRHNLSEHKTAKVYGHRR